MKRIAIFILLISTLVINAQTTFDISAYREDNKTIVFPKVSGDLSSRRLIFGVKSDLIPSHDLIILKLSSLSQITISFSGGYSTVSVKIIPNDTRDLSPQTYYYDLESVSASDTNDVVTLFKGKFLLNGDVVNSLNNTNLPDSGQRYLPIQTIKTLLLKLENGIVTVERKIGYGTITTSYIAGVLTVTSSGEFAKTTFIDTNQRSCNYYWVDANSFRIIPWTNYGTLSIKIYQED